MVKAVIDNLASSKPKNNFTIGIIDDLNHTSLKVTEEINTTPEGTKECILWGLGSDGTIGAAQAVCVNVIKKTG